MSRSQSRVFDILDALRFAGRPLTLTDLSKQAQIAPSSAHSILSVLVERNVVLMNSDKRYALGPELFMLGASYVKGTPVYRAVFRDLVRLAHQAHVAAAIAVTDGDRHLVLAVHDEPDAAVRLTMGTKVPLDAGSYGKVYFAYSGASVPQTLTSYTDATNTDREAYEREIEKVKLLGYATDTGEFVEDVYAVSAAVTSADGYAGLAALMSSSKAMSEYGIERAGEQLGLLCARASTVLGHATREPAWGEAY